MSIFEPKFERDKKGDIISPQMPKTFWQNINKSRWTYVFHFKDKHCQFHKIDYDQDAFNMRTDLPKFNLINYKLFDTDLPASNEWFKYRAACDFYLSKFFGPIFRNRGSQADIAEVDYFTLVLSDSMLQAIEKFIEDYRLSNYKDFIFYLIAKTEEVYLKDVEFCDRPSEKKKIKEFPKEVDKLYQVLKRSEIDFSENEKAKPELKQIVFRYNTTPPIKINDELLFSTLTGATIKDLGDGSRRNWEKQLKAFPNVYNDNQLPNEFRGRIVKAFHYFFKEAKLFDFGKHKTTDKEIEAIARILNFAHIRFKNNKGVEYDIDTDLYDIKQNIKLALSRKELAYNPSHFTVEEIKPDFLLLEKYFEKDFLMYGEPLFSQEEALDVASITSRFNCNHIFPQLIYIFSCLKAKHFQLGHQFQACINEEIENNNDYWTWKKIMGLVSSNKRVKHIKCRFEDDPIEYNLSENLSSELITQALKEYIIKHKFEFEIDFYESAIQPGPSPRSFKLVTTGKLNQPGNRFLSKFTKSCYEFLLKEWPPIEHEWSPSEKYFKIIGQLLFKACFFSQQNCDDDFVIEKIKYWYELTN